MPALSASLLGLFVQVGFALLTCGLVRKKNAANLVMLTFSATLPVCAAVVVAKVGVLVPYPACWKQVGTFVVASTDSRLAFCTPVTVVEPGGGTTAFAGLLITCATVFTVMVLPVAFTCVLSHWMNWL